MLATGLLRPRITQDSGIHKLVASAALGQIGRVLSRFRRRVGAAATAVVERVKSALREATRPLPLATALVMDLTRSRRELVAKNALLRQQLIVASRGVKRHAFRSHERVLLVLLARLVPGWRDAVLLVKPDTILRWHRQGFRLFWRIKSRGPSRPHPRISPDIIQLIRPMASENRLYVKRPIMWSSTFPAVGSRAHPR